MLPTPVSTDLKFYPPPPSWFGKYVVPLLIFLFFSGFLIFFWQDERHSFGAHIGFGLTQAIFALLLYKGLTDKSITCFTIGANQVTKEIGGQTTTLLFSEIKGFSEKTYKNATFTLIEPLDKKQSSLSVPNYFVDYDELRRQLARHVPDFDAAERERHERALAQATSELLHEVALGPTTQARQATLRQANGFVMWLTLAALVLALWLLIAWPYELVMALGLAVPLLALGALWSNRGVVRFVTGKDDPRPDVLLAILLPSVPLAVSSFGHFSFLSWQPLWPAAGGVAVAFALVLLVGSRRGTGQVVLRVGLGLLVAACYGFGASVVFNSAFGGGFTTRHLVRVTDKFQTRSKSSYLMFDSWGPADVPADLPVSPDYYQRKQAGDTITVRRYHGRLGADWCEVAGD